MRGAVSRIDVSKGNFTLNESSKSRRGFRPARATALAAIVAFATALACGCSKGGGDPFGEHDAVPILAAKVVQRNVADTIHAIGRVEAYSTVEIKAQINGQVTQVNFREGQDVKQGDLLFTIDP